MAYDLMKLRDSWERKKGGLNRRSKRCQSSSNAPAMPARS